MKQLFTRFAAIAMFGFAATLTPAALGQGPAGGGSPPPAASPSQRIVIVNIAKVLRDYDKANFQGAEITKKRQYYVNQVTALRDQLAEVNKEFTRAQDPGLKKQLQEKGLGLQRRIEDIDREAQRELTQVSNDTIVRVYQEIKGVIFDIAKTNGLSMVLCYPAASKAEDENSPQVAQLMLQTPALIPFYHQGMDITDVVVKTLNARYPSQKAPPIEPAGRKETSPPSPSNGPKPPIPGGGR